MAQSETGTSIHLDVVKEVVAAHLGVPVNIETLSPDQDLYAAGLTSLATVGLMLALEDRFDVEFPESMLSRSTFRSMTAITESLAKLAR